MASAFFGFNRGADLSPDAITESATATGSMDVELRVDLTKSLTRGEITDIVEAILRRINDGTEAFLGL